MDPGILNILIQHACMTAAFKDSLAPEVYLDVFRDATKFGIRDLAGLALHACLDQVERMSVRPDIHVLVQKSYASMCPQTVIEALARHCAKHVDVYNEVPELAEVCAAQDGAFGGMIRKAIAAEREKSNKTAEEASLPF